MTEDLRTDTVKAGTSEELYQKILFGQSPEGICQKSFLSKRSLSDAMQVNAYESLFERVRKSHNFSNNSISPQKSQIEYT